MNWQVDIGLLIELAAICAMAGMTYQSIVTLRRDVDKIEREIVDFRELKAELAVIKTELHAINSNLQRLIESKM